MKKPAKAGFLKMSMRIGFILTPECLQYEKKPARAGFFLFICLNVASFRWLLGF
jgi:hypothetical protein